MFLSYKRALLAILLFVLLILSFLSCHKSKDVLQYEIVLDKGWHIRSSKDINADGEMISSPDLDLEGWYPASVPATVLAVLVKNGVYSDPFFGKNLEKIPTGQFEDSWWYRTEFDLEMSGSTECARLKFDGINYRANIWLNGKQVASSDEIVGSFRVFLLDVIEFIRPGTNILAVEVLPPRLGDFYDRICRLESQASRPEHGDMAPG